MDRRLAHMGLPPRVRGSRKFADHNLCDIGSTPACAGKPLASSLPPRSHSAVWTSGIRVYPRVCGEAPRQVDIRKPPSFPKGIPHLYYTKYNTDVYNGGLVVLVDAVTIAWTAQTRRRGS